MKTLTKTLLLVTFAMLALAGCGGNTPNIPFLNSPTPTASNTPTPTSTSTLSPTPTYTPTITLTPTPVVPVSCSDSTQTQNIVNTFLKKHEYDSYESYLETLPEFSCEENECTYVPTDTYLNRWYQTAILRGAILGQFEIQDVNDASIGQTCLIFASREFKEPLPVLGAIQEDNRYIVTLNELGKRLFTRAMTKEKFLEWLSLHEGRIVDLGIILHLYDEATYERLETPPGKPYRDYYIKELSDIVLLEDSYTYKLANVDFSSNQSLEIYQYNTKLLNKILEEYDVLYATNIPFIDNWKLDHSYFLENPFIYDPEMISEQKTIYSDSLSFGFEEDYIYISDGDNYILDASNAYHGDSAISLKINKNFIGFNPNSWSVPISIGEYDALEFYWF